MIFEVTAITHRTKPILQALISEMPPSVNGLSWGTAPFALLILEDRPPRCTTVLPSLYLGNVCRPSSATS